jgi:predicted transposase YdaD
MEIVTSWEREGAERGRREGRREGAAEVTLKMLRRRLGPLSEDAEARVRRLSMERLDALGEALLDFRAMEDLDAWFAA